MNRKNAYLPCFICDKEMLSASPYGDNPPSEGTEFRTYGHYGSTFWDSFNGEELVLNICDDCLRSRTERLAQQKRFLPIRCEGLTGFGHQWVDRPMVAYTGNQDDGMAYVEPEELGTNLPGVEWADDIDERKRWLQTTVRSRWDSQDSCSPRADAQFSSLDWVSSPQST